MAEDLLRNSGFEADWAEERSHLCLVIPKGAEPYERDVGNVFTPPGWVTWFRHDPGRWDQPEVRDARAEHDARRVHAGEKAMLLFTFYRKHDAGFYQQTRVTPGRRFCLTAWAHAWSNLQDRPHEDDPLWSEGPGYEAGFLLAGQTPPAGSPGTYDDWMNFTFYVGIDPTGGTNPFADTVVWGQGAHIYNEYVHVPSVEAKAQAETVTLFLRSKTLWAFKHSDAYWDQARLDDVDVPLEVTISFEPNQPEVGKTVTVQTTSNWDHASVGLQVIGPNQASVPTNGPTATQAGGKSIWRWTFVPPEGGEYRARFSADHGTQTLAEGSLLATAPAMPEEARMMFETLHPRAGDKVGVLVSSTVDFSDVGVHIADPDGAGVPATDAEVDHGPGLYVWRWAFTAEKSGEYHVRFTADGGAATPAENTLHAIAYSGKDCVPPRIQYARVYVLLPQDAGVEWVTAVLESGKWDERRWTIGSSADDAGVGPRDRTVVAVNPARWGGSLTGFFAQYYPGVRYVPIDADTPAALAEKLGRM